MSQQSVPTELRVHQGTRLFEMRFEDGAHFRLPCEYLRVYSPSAEVRGHSPATAKLQVGKEAVSITDVRQIGLYAVKLVFDDGHDSGLYDWAYLYKLGRAWQPLWYEYLRQLKDAGHERQGPDPFEELQARGESPAELPAASTD